MHNLEFLGCMVGEEVAQDELCLIAGAVVYCAHHIHLQIVGKPDGEFIGIARLHIFGNGDEHVAVRSTRM